PRRRPRRAAPGRPRWRETAVMEGTRTTAPGAGPELLTPVPGANPLDLATANVRRGRALRRQGPPSERPDPAEDPAAGLYEVATAYQEIRPRCPAELEGWRGSGVKDA